MNNEIDTRLHSGGCGGEVKCTNAEDDKYFCLKCGHRVSGIEVVTFYKDKSIEVAIKVTTPWWKFW